MTCILALETALAACSAAIWRDGVIVARAFAPMARGHAEALLPMVEGVRADAGLAYSDFNRLAVSIGPGSFAGIRAGLAAARGFALALGLPLAGIGTLQLLAACAGGSGPVAAVVNARNAQVYFQPFSQDFNPLAPPALLAVDAASGWLRGRADMNDFRLAGDGAPLLVPLPGLDAGQIFPAILPDAAVLAGLAARYPGQVGHDVSPLYLRPPDARLPAAAA